MENQEKIQDLIRKVENQIKIIASRGKTATLWIQYFYLVLILRQFIYAERMGNWYLHLECVEKMIPLLDIYNTPNLLIYSYRICIN